MYHGELACGDLEIWWDLSKKCCHNIPLSNNKSKANFDVYVKQCIEKFNERYGRLLSGCNMRYMMAYYNINTTQLTYQEVEKFRK